MEEAARGLDSHGGGTGGILSSGKSIRAGNGAGGKEGGLCGAEGDDTGSPDVDVNKVGERS